MPLWNSLSYGTFYLMWNYTAWTPGVDDSNIWKLNSSGQYTVEGKSLSKLNSMESVFLIKGWES